MSLIVTPLSGVTVAVSVVGWPALVPDIAAPGNGPVL
jgi:hypothetical protein